MMGEQEIMVWRSYGIVKGLLEEKLQGMRFWFFIESGNKFGDMPLKEWEVVISSLHHDEIYSLDEMIGKEQEFCDKIVLKFLFSQHHVNGFF